MNQVPTPPLMPLPRRRQVNLLNSSLEPFHQSFTLCPNCPSLALGPRSDSVGHHHKDGDLTLPHQRRLATGFPIMELGQLCPDRPIQIVG